MIHPEREKKEYKDETGFNEEELDKAVEAGVFKRNILKKKKIKKTLFEKKAKKW